MRRKIIKEKRKDLQGRPEEVENRKEKEKKRKEEEQGEGRGLRTERGRRD